MRRRRFNREFKVEAVKLVRERGVSAAQAARDLDVHESCHPDLYAIVAQAKSINASRCSQRPCQNGTEQRGHAEYARSIPLDFSRVT
jgi:hypothetical protein